MDPVHANSRGRLISYCALSLIFLGGALASIWQIVEDDRQRGLLSDIRTHPQRIAYSGQLVWEGNIWGRPVKATLDIEHWAPGQTRVKLVKTEPEIFKAAKDSPWIRQGLSRLQNRLASSRMRRVWSGLWEESLLLHNYQARLSGAKPLAGRETLRLTLRSIHPDRPWLDMLVDRENRMPLQLIQYARDGQPSFKMSFTSIRYGKPQGKAPEQVTQRHRRPKPISLTAALKHESPPAVLTWLPDGFKLKEVQQIRRSTRWRGGSSKQPPGPPAWRVAYWDGLARITLYQFTWQRDKTRNRHWGARVPNQKQASPYKSTTGSAWSKKVLSNGLTVQFKESADRSVVKAKIGDRTLILVGRLRTEALLGCMSSITPHPQH